MEESKTTRIVLPESVHRDVKAEAARHGVRLDEALGMCVAWLVDRVVPLSWLGDGVPEFTVDLRGDE